VLLEFEHVAKQYRSWRGARFRALDDFSLSVERGEIFGFLGPNGAGKTTAIHIAMGFMRATSGGGSMLGKPFGHAATRARVGFLPENIALYHRHARALVHFYGGLNRVGEPELSARSKDLLDRLELTEHAERNAAKFSRGMQQRIGLAQALVNDPELLILDEPTSALDPLGRVTVREILLKARDEGKTIFLSSHMLSEVEAICDRVAILHRGRIVRQGTTSELLESATHLRVEARGVDAAVFEAAQARDGVVSFEIAADAQRAVVERVWAMGGEIVSINPVRRTLEEMFVELTGGEARR
jgi:ABC-2 type transport system ATP-binding protein